MSKPNDIPEFIVHSVPGSPYGRSVFVLLMEKGARYRLAPVAPVAPVAPQARKSEPHISRHPFGRVPVLDIAIFYFTRRKPSCVTSIAPCRSPR
jgi:hypothetical protein